MTMVSESLWMATSNTTSYPSVPSIGEDLEVDVAVVGGGIAGLSAGWELTLAGRSVAVIEADRLVAGTTGYTTAKLTALHGLIYAHLSSAFDDDTAAAYAASQLDALEHVVATAERLRIDCDLERRPAYTYVEYDDNVEQIRAEVAAAQHAGLPASLVTECPLPFPVAAAIRVEDQAQFHPRRYLLGVARELTRHGGRIFERSRVVDLANEEGGPRLTTEVGATIRARDVVVATHYPVFDAARLFTRLTPTRELVVAAPIAAADDPGGMYLTREHATRSVRTAPYEDGQRLLIVTGEQFTPGASGVAERLQRLTDWMRQHFVTGPVTHRWAAQDNMTTDRLPYVGRFPGEEHVWVATGFGGWGMTNGVMAGRLLTELITGRSAESPLAKIYDPRRIHPTVEAGRFLSATLAVARHFVGDRIRPPAHADSVDDIAAGSGAIVRVGGERCAVHRDDTGQLHAVSAVCTHLGCTVAFNDAERTWDCPCHGSRFGIDGAVRNGPATAPLGRRDAPKAGG